MFIEKDLILYLCNPVSIYKCRFPFYTVYFFFYLLQSYVHYYCFLQTTWNTIMEIGRQHTCLTQCSVIRRIMSFLLSDLFWWKSSLNHRLLLNCSAMWVFCGSLNPLLWVMWAHWRRFTLVFVVEDSLIAVTVEKQVGDLCPFMFRNLNCWD